jgi:hypothetical protein
VAVSGFRRDVGARTAVPFSGPVITGRACAWPLGRGACGTGAELLGSEARARAAQRGVPPQVLSPAASRTAGAANRASEILNFLSERH